MFQVWYTKLFRLIIHLCWTSSILSQDRVSGRTHANEGSSYVIYQRPDYPRDCQEASSQCSQSYSGNVYQIKPDGYPEPFEVYCDNKIDSGGWTVISRIEDGSLLFNRTWTEYKTGFGFLSHEFWIGNDKLSFLTNQNIYELRIDFTSADDESFYITYSKFRITDEHSAYNLTSVGEYNGTEENIALFLCPANSEGVVYIPPDCSSRCTCSNGQFTCDETYRCSPNAVCDERNSTSQCHCNEGYTGDGVNCTLDIPLLDCQDIYDRVSNESGVYKIKPTTWPGEPFDVYCNMSDGGGWTVFQRRIDGTQDFHLYWSDYKQGFGRPDHELWLGNDQLNNLTVQRNYELRVDLVNSLGDPYYAKYNSFIISDESNNYRLSLGSYSGNAGDAMIYSNGQAFTTRDQDNDQHSSNCAALHNTFSHCNPQSCDINAGWWYNNCGYSYLNSPYGTVCFLWYYLPGSFCNVKFSEMKIRPV